MTLVIADTKAQADYSIYKRQLKDTRYVSDVSNVLGMSRMIEIVAVGPCRENRTYYLINDLRDRGYTVTYLGDTL
jgi:hypothetical protein